MRTCFSMDPLTVDPRKNGDLISSSFYPFNQGSMIDPKFSHVEFSPLDNLHFHKITLRDKR